MRVLVLADVHGNWEALEAVRRPFDLCVCLGDLVDYGPEPGRVIGWVRENCRHVVRGNHDHGVAQRVPATGDSGYRYLTAVTRPWCCAMVSDTDRQYLARLPLTQYLRVDGKVLLLVHATPRDPLDEYLFADEANWRRRLAGVDADILCVGHTHHQYLLEVDGTQIVNPGSVGQPRDGDPRAGFAIIEDGVVTLGRAEYDVERTIAKMNALDFPTLAKELSAEVWRTGGRATFAAKG